MTSRFIGRDYNTLRQEIIDFLRKRLPSEWDYTNLADPVVIFAESMARMGDQLHYTIDELRRECDISTAKRASSVYSYAMREGYKMMLPKGANGTISVNTTKEQSARMKLTLNRFDEIKVGQTGISLYVDTVSDNTPDSSGSILYEAPNKEYLESIKNNLFDYAAYTQGIFNRTVRIGVVLGKLETFNFTYHDINSDSTVTLPIPYIDRDLLSLIVTDSSTGHQNGKEMEYTEDIIASGFVGDIYTLTPKFIGGAITLNIEFPTDYKTMFRPDAVFSFKYIKIQNATINDDQNTLIDLSSYISPVSDSDKTTDNTTYIESSNGTSVGSIIINLNGGIKGYREYEDYTTTRENYKNFVQNYSALLTKNDYANYMKIATNSYCSVYDHSDGYKDGVLPSSAKLIPRVVYIITDAPFKERERLWNDLIERSSRSDVIMLMPYGKDPYTIIVKAECFLMGTSISEIATKIKSELLQYYDGNPGEKIPEISKINYLVHKASDKVVRMDSVIVRDSTYGEKDADGNYVINQDFADANTLSNNDVEDLFNAIKSGDTSKVINYNVYRLTGLDSNGHVYNKYPVVTYNAFPDSFPSIYLNNSGYPIESYDVLVQHAINYDAYDNEQYDQDPLFNEERSIIDIVDESVSQDTEEALDGCTFYTESFIVENTENASYYVKSISDEYIKHHYMVPVLNRVVVLIKAIGN